MNEIGNYKELFGSLKLSISEKLIVSQFAKTDKSKSFVSVAEILKNHGKPHEAIELLMLGLEWYPRYSAARVILAKEYFELGFMEEAWELLHKHGDNLDNNFAAMKLILKLAIVLGIKDTAYSTLEKMNSRNLVDGEVGALSQKLLTISFEAVRRDLIEDLEKAGIRLVSYGLPVVAVSPSDSETGSIKNGKKDRSGAKGMINFDERLSATGGFYVASMGNVLKLISSDIVDLNKNELDSCTQAQIYENQGCYSKALDIYRTLLSNEPLNEYFKLRVEELARELKKQQRHDVYLDAKIALRLKKAEVFDRKIRFLYKLMDKLG